MRKFGALLCALALLLSGCAAAAEPQATVPTTTAPQPTEPKITVSPEATEDFMEPFGLYSRTRDGEVEFVMLHFSSAIMTNPEDPYDLASVRATFRQYEVSPHYIIDREGNIYCYIPEDRAAYQAGYGTWGDDPKYTDLMNDYSIGIELVAIGSAADMAQYLSAWEYSQIDPSLPGYTEAQYEALDRLLADLCSRYDIPLDRDHIIGHEDYSPHKSDPGELFNWDRILP